jgi:hypothetical protein
MPNDCSSSEAHPQTELNWFAQSSKKRRRGRSQEQKNFAASTCMHGRQTLDGEAWPDARCWPLYSFILILLPFFLSFFVSLLSVLLPSS